MKRWLVLMIVIAAGCSSAPSSYIERAKAILSHLELNSTKPDAKKQGPKAKNTRQPTMPEPNPPQMDLFGEM